MCVCVYPHIYYISNTNKLILLPKCVRMGPSRWVTQLQRFRLDFVLGYGDVLVLGLDMYYVYGGPHKDRNVCVCVLILTFSPSAV